MILKSKNGEKGIQVFDDLRIAEIKKSRTAGSAYQHQIPELPGWCDRYYSAGNFKYNPARLICNCKEYQESAAQFVARDIRLLCRHLTGRYLSPPLKKLLDPLTVLLLENQVKRGREKLGKYETGESFFLTGAGKSKVWINMYVYEKRWRKFIYNAAEKRWGYNSAPENKNLPEYLIESADNF